MQADQPSLHQVGWRQGSVVDLQLSSSSFVLDGAQPAARSASFSTWVVASQDCDLDSAEIGSNEPTIELRPTRTEGCPAEWGIRSRRVRLGGELYVVADDPRIMVSPALLDSARARRAEPLSDGRAKAFKTWLGLRYDRPAIPERFRALSVEIGTALARKGKAPDLADSCSDVLVQYDDGPPVGFALWAVVEPDADKNSYSTWLIDAALTVPATLGVMTATPLVVGRDELSLDVIENSYAADLSKLSWRREEPRGAV